MNVNNVQTQFLTVTNGVGAYVASSSYPSSCISTDFTTTTSSFFSWDTSYDAYIVDFTTSTFTYSDTTVINLA